MQRGEVKQMPHLQHAENQENTNTMRNQTRSRGVALMEQQELDKREILQALNSEQVLALGLRGDPRR